jgi:hypothetical protein
MLKHNKEESALGCSRLCITSVALAAGLVNGLGLIILALVANETTNYGVPIIHLLASIYKGYAPGLTGALWGGLWGFLDAFFCGLLFAVIYNWIVYCCKCGCKLYCKKSSSHRKT